MVDKKLGRVIKGVLMQMIRNAVVHGIEMPEDRIAKGKNETGTIRLSIKRDDNTIHVRLRDDGNGLDFNKIRERAVQMNLIQAEDEDNRDALINVLFEPGFSTAETEGGHAGRGIGLNLVKDRVTGMNGSIKLQTEANKGTVFNIYFPLESS